jgi:predicted MPP superfamily phosphohydrolase
VLDNAHDVLRHGGATLVVAGMPDPAARGRRGTGHGPDLAAALAGAPEGAPRLLLHHPPRGYEAAERAGIQLQLSGHTHSGQYFPWSLVVRSLYRYPAGLHRHGGMWIYTSVGTGFWGPPNRFLVPPELTLLVLRRA